MGVTVCLVLCLARCRVILTLLANRLEGQCWSVSTFTVDILMFVLLIFSDRRGRDGDAERPICVKLSRRAHYRLH